MATFIKTATTGVVTTFGKFTTTCKPGLKFYVPFLQRIFHVSNRTQQKEFQFRVKTKDDVFAKLSLAIQFKIKEENTEKAFFSLDDPISQMSSFVENSIRSQAPLTTLTGMFESFDSIGSIVSIDLSRKMNEHGYTIENILMTGIEPDSEVTNAINRTSASKRLKEAAQNEADANYIRKIKESEADRDRKILQGNGIAGQRKAILDGYMNTFTDMMKLGLNSNDIMNFVLKSQALDTKEQIGKSPNTKILFMEGNDENTSLSKTIMSSMEAVDTKIVVDQDRSGLTK